MEEITHGIVSQINSQPELNTRTCHVGETEVAPVPRPRSFVQPKFGTFQRTFSLRVPPRQPTDGLAPSLNQEILKIKDMIQVAQTELKADLSNQKEETDLQIAHFKVMQDNLKKDLNSMIKNQNDEISDKLKQTLQKIVEVEMDVSALKKYFDRKIQRKSIKLVENTNECLMMLASMVDKELEKIQKLRETEKEEIEKNMERKMEDMVIRMVERKISELKLQSESSQTLTPISSSELVWSEEEDHSSFDGNQHQNHQQTPEQNSNHGCSDVDSTEDEAKKIEEEFRKKLADQNQVFVQRFNSFRERRNQVNRDAEEESTRWRRRFIRDSPDRCSLQEGKAKSDHN